MKIKRIKKIKKTGILQNFDGSNLLPDLIFKDINLIFGWNGTGKTTLARVLRCFEIGEVCKKLQKYPKLECEIELDNGIGLSEADFANKQQIRVFNKDFVEENIFQNQEQDGGNVRPLYYLGKEKIELTKERKERDENQRKLGSLEKDHQEKIKGQEKFAKDTSREIKDNLLGIKEYQYYHKDSFIESFNKIKKGISVGDVEIDKLKLPEREYENKLKTVKNYEALKSWIEDIINGSNTIDSAYIKSIDEILGKAVSLQKTIEKLKEDWELSKWVQDGIPIHKNRNSSECEFCGQKLPTGRIAELEQHFNEDYTALANLVVQKIAELRKLRIKEKNRIPNEDTKNLAELLNSLLDKLISKLEFKQKNILGKQSFDENEKQDIETQFKSINRSAGDIINRISGTVKELENSLIADHFNEYDKIISDIEINNKQINLIKTEIGNLEKTIKESEKSINDFELPAKEINKALEEFLGHPELKIEGKKDKHGEDYYEIKRNGEIAFNLSESEKTAISLIYFLKKLGENKFELSKGLVFIDDPISSLDSQYLYSAYAFIVAAIEENVGGRLKVGQFFLSTHSYDFFNLFKKKYWQSSKKPQDGRCNLYMLRVKMDHDIGRCSNIYELDKLLKKYDSDYQYLYSQLIDYEKASEIDQSDLGRIYQYPNIARRVLETFLSFKFPAKTDLQAKIDAINKPKISKEIKESVYRFINIKSHGTLRETEGFSPEILEPTAKSHILNVLMIMREVDIDHCREMESDIN